MDSKKSKWDLLGKRCRDIVTGYEGIATAVIENMSGCSQYKVESEPSPMQLIEHDKYFFEGQLEEVGPGITDKVVIPEYTEPLYFGKLCEDKLIGIQGVCVGRVVFLFNADQYVLEYQPEDLGKEIRRIWLDEGRIKPVSDPTEGIDPDTVKSTRNGGILPDNAYPYKPGFTNIGI